MASPLIMLTIAADGKSDIGKVRQANQDAFAVDADRHIYIVADGMGGHSGGEVASWKAVETVLAVLRDPQTDENTVEPADRVLVRAIQAANEQVFRMAAEDRRLHGMGTTLVALRLSGPTAVVGSVGDSRVYLWRDGQLRQVTSDHSLVNEYVRLGTLSAEEASTHPLKHIISRAIGVHPTVDVDQFTIPLKPGDLFLLCSDGLTNMLDQEEIAAALAAVGGDPSIICAECINRANAKGGLDNITVVAVHCVSV
ncbi:MAG: Stp1/IreP family PP2C-type Ser/Thr phosphatase [Nitrospirota bacterium]